MSCPTRTTLAVLATLALLATGCTAFSFTDEHDSEFLWGTYRPNLYFGTRTRSTDDPVLTGLMWSATDNAQRVGDNDLRHECKQEDKLSFGWREHDGRSYGKQVISDAGVGATLTTSFVKRPTDAFGGEWSVRVSGSPLGHSGDGAPANVSLLFYVGVDGDSTPGDSSGSRVSVVGGSNSANGIDGDVVIDGYSRDTGKFSIVLSEASGSNKRPEQPRSAPRGLPSLSKTHFTEYRTSPGTLWSIKDRVRTDLEESLREAITAVGSSPGHSFRDAVRAPYVYGTLDDTAVSGANVAVVQAVFTLPFSVDITYVSRSTPRRSVADAVSAAALVSGTTLSQTLAESSRAFSKRFEETFKLKASGDFNGHEIRFAKHALANMLGSVGFFHGASRMKETNSYGPVHSLLASVPSRSFFPRGFLWDEGFHQLLMGEWDEELSIDVLWHWLSSMDESGYIAREQILGPEAESRVPAEFIRQSNEFANPPTFYFAVKALVQRGKRDDSPAGRAVPGNDFSRLSDDAVSDFLRFAYDNLRKQYEWFKNTQAAGVEDGFRWRGRSPNHTLTSGLDDYPRGEPPSDREAHVDLLCWMAYSAGELASLAEHLGYDGSTYARDSDKYTKMVTELHWDSRSGLFADLADVNSDGSGRKYAPHAGYISLFPLLLETLEPSDPHVGDILALARDRDHLYSKYGLRSLSTKDAQFGVEFPHHYWKGPIWVNINYLFVSALHSTYAAAPSANQAAAAALYRDVRSNIIKTVYRGFSQNVPEKGFIYEQYRPTDGHGQGCRPFTGWSSLVVLLMSQRFPHSNRAHARGLSGVTIVPASRATASVIDEMVPGGIPTLVIVGGVVIVGAVLFKFKSGGKKKRTKRRRPPQVNKAD